MKQIFIIIIALFTLGSCKKKEEIVPEKVVELIPKKSEFGFVLADFNIVNDTIERGDTFGTIIQNQNLAGRKVYEIVAQVRDSFDVRGIRTNKPFTLLRSKDKKHKLEYFIYQPDNLSYFVIDMRDTIVSVYTPNDQTAKYWRCFKRIPVCNSRQCQNRRGIGKQNSKNLCVFH